MGLGMAAGGVEGTAPFRCQGSPFAAQDTGGFELRSSCRLMHDGFSLARPAVRLNRAAMHDNMLV
jgi:hypothetical protein